MTAPQLTVYRQGQGVVSGDGANTFCQTCDTFSDLRAFIGVPGVQVFARGGGSVNDGLGGNFYWQASGTGPDDGINIIVPTGAALGCWVRVQSDIRIFGIEKELNGNGSTPSTGIFDDGFLPFACTITGWVLQPDQQGSCVIDVWAAPFSDSAYPTVANSITGATPPTLAAAKNAHNYAVSGWTTALPARTALRYNLVSVATITRVTLTLIAQRPMVP